MTIKSEWQKQVTGINYQVQVPPKDFLCRLGLHLWTRLNWIDSTPIMILDEFTNKAKVERHCAKCGKYETYLLEKK